MAVEGPKHPALRLHCRPNVAWHTKSEDKNAPSGHQPGCWYARSPKPPQMAHNMSDAVPGWRGGQGAFSFSASPMLPNTTDPCTCLVPDISMRTLESPKIKILLLSSTRASRLHPRWPHTSGVGTSGPRQCGTHRPHFRIWPDVRGGPCKLGRRTVP